MQSAGSEPALAGTTWLAEDIGRRGVLDNPQTTMSFTQPGRVSGGGGCNRYAGPVEITGEAIRFGPLTGTRMACAPAIGDQEERFFAALWSATRFGFTPDGKLVLYDRRRRRHLRPRGAVIDARPLVPPQEADLGEASDMAARCRKNDADATRKRAGPKPR